MAAEEILGREPAECDPQLIRPEGTEEAAREREVAGERQRDRDGERATG
jgi:hypothetical protein